MLQVQPALPATGTMAAFVFAATLLLALRRFWRVVCAGVVFDLCWAALPVHAALRPTLVRMTIARATWRPR